MYGVLIQKKTKLLLRTSMKRAPKFSFVLLFWMQGSTKSICSKLWFPFLTKFFDPLMPIVQFIFCVFVARVITSVILELDYSEPDWVFRISVLALAGKLRVSYLVELDYDPLKFQRHFWFVRCFVNSERSTVLCPKWIIRWFLRWSWSSYSEWGGIVAGGSCGWNGSPDHRAHRTRHAAWLDGRSWLPHASLLYSAVSIALMPSCKILPFGRWVSFLLEPLVQGFGQE